jgi:hypothetical protein
VDLSTIDLDSLVVTVDGAVATGWFHEEGVIYFDAPLRSSGTTQRKCPTRSTRGSWPGDDKR